MPTVIPNHSLLLLGEPKTGKTHFSLTYPAPILLVSLDLGADFVIQKHYSGKDIKVLKYELPIVDTLKPQAWAEPLWTRIKTDYETELNSKKYKTVILDTGTSLWEIIRYSFVEEQNRNQLRSRDYGEPNARFTAILQKPILMGINMVTINHLKDEYVEDKSTGKKVIDGFRRTNSYVDIIASSEFRKATKKMIVRIEDCRFDPMLTGIELPNPSYADLMMLLGVKV